MAETRSAQSEKPLTLRHPIVWLGVLTVVWLAVVLTMVAKRQQCGGADVPILFEGLIGFHQNYLSCRSLNDLGDFLAGAFASLALAWLAGAVYLQTVELREQRLALLVQMEETRATTAQLRGQTHLLEQERRFREQGRVMEAVIGIINSRGGLRVNLTYDGDNRVNIGLPARTDDEPITYFRKMNDRLEREIERFDSGVLRKQRVDDWVGTTIIDEIIATIEASRADLSPELLTFSDRLGRFRDHIVEPRE